MIVVDTNVVAHLLIPNGGMGLAEKLYKEDPAWSAPPLWRSEFRNVLARRVRNETLAFHVACLLQQRAERILSEGIEVDSAEVLALARDSRCTSYDCEFVALALQLDTTLVTADREVLRAFPGVAVPFH